MKKAYIHPQAFCLTMHSSAYLLAGSGEQVNPDSGINPNSGVTEQSADFAASRGGFWED